ncbi:MAG: TIGR03067 domain-containing protein [Nitrospira sp.]|nr:TIGR03067 domain-containing protein [Nitrospira sp.]
MDELDRIVLPEGTFMYSLTLGLAVIVAAPAPKDGKNTSPSIIGDWRPESILLAGMPLAGDEGVKSIHFRAEGQGSAVSVKKKPEAFTYSIDWTKSPAHIDLTELGPKGPETQVLGILKLEGDTLTICLAIDGERPKDFASTRELPTLLLVLKRMKNK